MMEWYVAFGLLMAILLFLMAIGVPVGIAFMGTNMVFMLIMFAGPFGLLQIVDNSTDMITSFVFSPIPMFILMGALFFRTGLASRVFDGIDMVLGRMPGRLSYLAIGGGTAYSALTGSTMANTAMLASTLVPEMQRRGYSYRMAMGPILGTGGLATIIPPSSLAILLAGLASLNVADLLIAGIAPGLMLAAAYALTVYVQARLDPAGAPVYQLEEKGTVGQRLRAFVVGVIPMVGVVALVIALILFGITTPTEAAAFGVLGVLAVAAAYRVLTMANFSQSVRDTTVSTGVLFFILINSTVFSQVLSLSGASSGLIEWVLSFDLSPLMLVVAMVLVTLFLGMMMDSMSIMLITVPLFYPLIATIGFDPIAFSVILLISIEMGMTTPPFGMLLFIGLGFSPKGTTIVQVTKAALPYLLCDAAVLMIILLIPAVASFLPYLTK